MSNEKGRLNGAVLRKMAQQLQSVMDDIEHNSMISNSTRAKMRAEMQLQLDALTHAADTFEHAYGKAPQVIEGTPFAKESGNA